MKRWLILCGLLTCASPVWAHEPDDELAKYPLLHPSRLSIGARVEYDWYSGHDAAIPEFRKEFAVGIAVAYNLVPKLSAIGGTTYGLDNRQYRTWVGVNLQIFRGKP